MFEFGVLGPLSIHRHGDPVTLRARTLRRLLAVLLCHPNRPVTIADLADELWDGTPPPAASRSVQVYVYRLRRALGEDGRIVHDPAGYRVAVAPDELDVVRFAELTGAGRAARQQGDLARAATLLGQALNLWRGAPYADIDRGRLIAEEAHRLDEQRLLARQDRIEVELDLGRAARVVADLADVAGAHPYRERLQALHMLALYRCGRQAEALDVFRSTRARLVEELGVEPGELLQRLQRAVLDTDERLARVATGTLDTTWEPVPPVPAGPTPAVPHELPGDIAGFTGRDDALQTLDKLLPGDQPTAPAPVVISAIAGTAGIGKTALAIHWAHRVADRFRHGQLYVNLRGFDPVRQPMAPAEALHGFLTSLGVPPQRIPTSVDARASQYRSLLAGRKVLVVLDNAREPAQVRPLLPGTPGCLVVVTSRDRLTSLVATDGAHCLPLNLLSHDEAERLLARRLGADRLAAEPGATEEIITRCAGLPLALAVVAARIATGPDRHPLGEHATALREARTRLDVLSDADPAIDIRAAFDVSYRVLTPEAARLFRLLGLHPGPDLSLPAAASLAGIPPGEARPLLAELTRTHLINEHVAGRYTCHDLMRTYATELGTTADTGPTREAATRRMLDFYLHTAHRAAGLLSPHRKLLTLEEPQPGVAREEPAGAETASAWLGREHPVLVGLVALAASTGFDAYTWRLAWTISDFLYRNGYWDEWETIEVSAIDAARRLADPHALALTHRSLARARLHRGSYDDARRHLLAALEHFHELGDQGNQARTHYDIAVLLGRLERHREALTHAERALTLYRADGDLHGQAIALNGVGWIHVELGEYEQALPHCRQALALHQQVGSLNGQAATWDSLGFAHHHLGQYPQAADSYQRALNLLREQGGERYSEAETLDHLGDAHHAAGDPDAAREAWRDALTILEMLDHVDADLIRQKLRQGRP